MNRIRFSMLAGLAAVFLTAGAAGAVTVDFNFDSGMGPNFTFAQVNTTSVALDDTGGDLRIYSGGMDGSGVRGGEVRSIFTLQGDFDIRVDFRIIQSLESYQQVEVHPYDMTVFYPIRDNWPDIGGNNYHVWVGNSQGVNPTSDLSGTLRVQRVDSTAYGYFWDQSAGDYHLMYSSGVSTADISLGLMVQNNSGQGGSFNVAFDNLSVTADAIIGLVPIPPGLLLAGTGLGLLAMGRRRRHC